MYASAAWATSTQPNTAVAGLPTTGTDGGPLEVTAQQSLEYHQEEHVYIARGAAKLTRGDVTITANELRAYERTQADNKKVFFRFVADGNVIMSGKEQQIYGDHAVYDADQRQATLTGKNLRFVGQNATVTAQDALEYWPDKQQAVARGRAHAVRDDRQVTADRLTAQFAKNAQGQSELTHLLADGQVVITTSTDVAEGDHAIYDMVPNRARLEGGVRISRGASHLAGEAAEVDFKTGVSRLVAANKNTRVKALFVPADKDSKDVLPLPIPATPLPHTP